ncbi:MAG: glycogen/starch/alpha-glucan phosphorylase [Coprobacillus sp.]|nr:glycogen/starch/alpha-glucan phosphorylase [Coprobacillus sp.]
MFQNKEVFKNEFEKRLAVIYGNNVQTSDITERFNILGGMVRDYASPDWRSTRDAIQKNEQRQLIYFSMEFLIGRLLVNNMMNLGIYQVAKEGLEELGLNIHELEETESDAGLGNGGLGRLAACFLDSIASLGYPGSGNCIRYEYGFFKQKITQGHQTEVPDQWLSNGNVWEIRKPKHAVEVKFYGRAETYQDEDGRVRSRTVDAVCVKAVPYDVSVVGYHNHVANTLRLWSAEPSEENIPQNQKFSDYLTTLRELCHGLYPDDSTEHGKILRLRQQYFLVSAGLQSAIRGHLRQYGTLDNFADKYVFQLNDTHPILAIPELMRLLMDEYHYGWDDAWKQVQKCMAYTNHTIMAEALEKWPVHYVQQLIPRCYMIIEEINRRFQIFLSAKGFSDDRRRNVSIIKEGMIHMTNLAIYACYSINGVAALHTKILEENTFRDFYELFPEKFNNKTNGVTHRRWFLYANPRLAEEVTNKIGETWILHPEHLEDLMAHVDDEDLQGKFLEIKQENKEKLALFIKEHYDIDVDSHSIFDVQIKRLHAYKRQLMNVFHIMSLYFKMKENPAYRITPHTFIFGAKAAPSYAYAKKIIELILDVARVVNNDPEISPYMKVVFMENYGVSLAELIIPAADISEQISTAGKEASGTSNMKFMMNGAITLGTLDGANVEIAERVGDDNCVIFGLKDYEVNQLRWTGTYNPWDMYNSNPMIKRVMDSLLTGEWAEDDKDKYRMIFDEIMYRSDEYFILKDVEAYSEAFNRIVTMYSDRMSWAKKCLINIAKSGYFSSDRTIEQYAKEIWHIEKIEK